MKFSKIIYLSLISFLTCIQSISAELIYVTTELEFNDAHDSATMEDSIVWRTGIYSDIFMEIDNDHLFIMAEELGSVIFNGSSRVDITSDYVTLQGFQFIGGNVKGDDIVHTRGDYNVFTQLNFRAYQSNKYLRVREQSQYCEITYCNFENRLNLDDQNILSILVDNDTPGYHKIQHCSFKNFDGSGNDLGIEPIRIGVSSQADFISRSLVEYCYFTQCNGDGELISSKARQNVYRFNTFEDNPLAELVLRHGSENIVYGNFFLNGKGGVRVREGQDQYIYNNYFHDLDDRAIYLQNESSDPLDNINIAFNTIVNCAELRLGRSGSNRPTNVTFANNIFADPIDDLFEQPTETETWINNIAFGDLGIPLPESGITVVDPELEENAEGFFGLSASSPAIDAAVAGYKLLPQFEGIDDIDADVLFDLMGQERPSDVTQRDLGSNEFPHDVVIKPIATEENTGPSYDSSTSTNVEDNTIILDNLIEVYPNPVADYLFLTIHGNDNAEVQIEVFDFDGKLICSLSERRSVSGAITISKNIDELPIGTYTVRATSSDHANGVIGTQTIRFVKVR